MRETQKREAQKRVEAQKLQAREAQERVLRQRAVATGGKEKEARDAFEERFRVMEKDHMFSGGDHRLVHGGVLLHLEEHLSTRASFARVNMLCDDVTCGSSWLCVPACCLCVHVFVCVLMHARARVCAGSFSIDDLAKTLIRAEVQEAKPDAAAHGTKTLKLLAPQVTNGVPEHIRFLFIAAGREHELDDSGLYAMDLTKMKEGFAAACPAFLEAKAAGRHDANLGRMPVLVVDGVPIGQSAVIKRLVAKRVGLYSDDDVEAAQMVCVLCIYSMYRPLYVYIVCIGLCMYI